MLLAAILKVKSIAILRSASIQSSNVFGEQLPKPQPLQNGFWNS